jgi:2-polyprenyl-6-methoxyphenol hydroxylase-like FAD-dependent oxidoreductase
MANQVSVLIVGAGPVGLALAGDLGWRGVSCTLIEKTDGAIFQPRMDMVGVRTMEFCRRWGIADWVENSPYPRDYPQDNVYLESLRGVQFGREYMPPKKDEPYPVQSPQKRERCPQDMFDPILQRFVAQYPHVQTLYRTELVTLNEGTDGVAVTVRDLEKNEERLITADYVVGTDGGASYVRQLLGFTMTGKPVLTYTTNVIFRCEDLPSLHDKGRAYRFIFIGPEGTWLTVVAIDGADRWRMSIVGTNEKRTYSENEIRQYILRAMGGPFDFEIESILPWVRRELVADSYGTDRIFIAGDAAHLMSPTGGFGMNTGIADSIDLGWKLEAVLKGWGGKGLLQSYEIERLPVAQRAVAEASGNLERMLATKDKAPPPEAYEPGPKGDAARNEFGDWYTETMRREWFSIGIHLGFNYYHSPIVWPDGSAEPADTVSTYEQTGRPGHRAPHFWLKDGQSILDLFGRGFVLLRLSEAAIDVSAMQIAADDRNVPFQVVTLDDANIRVAYGADLVLVRPDGHVSWRSNALPEDAGAILDVVRGATTRTAIPSYSATVEA